MDEYLNWLGYPARDVVTSFEGVVDSVCFDLYGCVMVSLCPPHDQSKDADKQFSRWFDIKRVRKTGDPVMERPKFEAPGSEIGAAAKAPYGRR